ncbi:MAG: tetratricopeptide repeat protein [Woeseia sp.]
MSAQYFKLATCGVLIAIFSSFVNATSENTKQVPPYNTDVLTKYENLRDLARSGNAESKFDAFIFVYEHASDLQDQAKEAVSFLFESAVAGNLDAQYNLGYLLQTGRWIERDEEKALLWLLEAASRGHITAQVRCGIVYQKKYYEANSDLGHNGNLRRPELREEAENWFREVISNGRPEQPEVLVATESLGRLLVREKPESDEGWDLLKEAAQLGYEPAIGTLRALMPALRESASESYEPAKRRLKELKDFLVEIENRSRVHPLEGIEMMPD